MHFNNRDENYMSILESKIDSLEAFVGAKNNEIGDLVVKVARLESINSSISIQLKEMTDLLDMLTKKVTGEL